MKMTEKPTRKSPEGNAPVAVYLILYNCIQFLGWSCILFTVTLHVYTKETHKGAYKSVAELVKIFQTAAVLEVVHALLGFVRTNPVLTGFQVASRVFLVWGIAVPITAVHNTYGMLMLLYAWSVTEIIRYLYYSCSLTDQVPYLLTWARYTFFIILYPIGVTGELLCIYNSLQFVKRTNMFSMFMPNVTNMSFDYHSVLYIVMAAYIPIFPQLYLHMFAQRRKILGGDKKKFE